MRRRLLPSLLVLPSLAMVAGGGAAPAPGSSRELERAVSRIAAQAAPRDELFALIRVTDRETGERRELTRGTLAPEILERLADPALSPPGIAYDEGDSAHAGEGIEVAVRSVRARAARVDPGVLTRAQEEEEGLSVRHAGGGLSHRIGKGLRRRLGSGEVDPEGGDLIPVVVEMKDVPRLRPPKVGDLDEAGLLWTVLEVAAAREQSLIARKKMMPGLQRDLVAAIEDAGGRVQYASWGSGAIDALLPARAIPGLAEHRSVLSIEYAEPAAPANHYYQGDDYYVATDAEDFDVFHPGNHGLTSRHPYTSRVVLGMAEQCIDQNHPGWLNAGGGETRGFFYDCDPSGACSQGGVESCSGSSAHGTQVAGVMTADFMDGQGTFTNESLRRALTGTCPECRFFFLQDQGLNQRNKTHDAACDLGVDIFESSIGTVAWSCDGDGPFQGSVQNLIDCGAVYIQSAGNNGSTGGVCSTVHPADHPWTLTISGMQTLANCDDSGDYYTSACVIDPGSSRGGAEYDGNDGAATVIDLAAPYWFHSMLVPMAYNPVGRTSNSGTSFATPLVAGLTALVMDWYKQHIGTSIFYANRARNFMMLFGDRSSGSDGASRLTSDTSVFWGAGRVGLVPFDTRPFWDVERRQSEVGRNDTWSFTVDINPAATFFKAVVWHDGTNYANEPLIRFSLDPAGCPDATRSVDRLDNKVMQVYTDLAGCTAINVSITNVGEGFSGARVFHFAAYTDIEDEREF